MQGYREECLAAGMNDYVSKPIDPAQLFAVLARWIKPAERQKIERPAAPTVEDEVDLPASLPGFDVAAGLLRLGGNRRLYRKLLVDFGRNYADCVERIEQLLASGDLPTALRLAHTVKGIGGNLSAQEVHAAAGALEAALHEQKTNEYVPLLTALKTAVEKALESIGILQLEPDQVALASVEIDRSEVEVTLSELSELLANDSPAAIKQFARLEAQLRGEIGVAPDLKNLGREIDAFEFETALELLKNTATKLGLSVED